MKADLAITGGVHTAEDVLKAMMAGAQVAMMASALHVQGIDHLMSLTDQVVRWMTEHEYESIRQMRGSLSRRSVPDTSAFERGNYIKTSVRTPSKSLRRCSKSDDAILVGNITTTTHFTGRGGFF